MSGEIVKVCKVHGGLSENLVYKHPKGYLTCRECQRECGRKNNSKRRLSDDAKEYHRKYIREYWRKNKEKMMIVHNKWSSKNRDKTRSYNKKYKNNNYDNYLLMAKERRQKAIKLLTNSYVNMLLKQQVEFKNFDNNDLDFLRLVKTLQIKYFRIFNQPMRRSK